MKKLILFLIALFWGSAVFLVKAAPVLAVTEQDGDLEVTYDNPLFGSDIIWYPGLSVTKNFSVQNHGGEDHIAQIKAQNTSDTDNLAEVLFVEFSENGQSLYGENDSKTMSDFWQGDYVDLKNHQPGNLYTYSMTITFDPAAGNQYQDQQVTFDLLVRFPEKGGGEVVIEGGGAGTGGGTGGTGGTVAGTTTNFTGLTPTVFGTQTEEPSEVESETETTIAPGKVKGAACEETYYPWWLPLLIQGILSLAFYGFIWRKSKPTAWLLVPTVLAIISQIVHEILGCNCATGELCPWFWVFNLVIFLLPALFYWWYHQGKTDRNS